MGLGRSKPSGRGPVAQNNQNVRAEITFNVPRENHAHHFQFKKKGHPVEFKVELDRMLQVIAKDGISRDPDQKNRRIILIEINDANIASELYDVMLTLVNDSGFVAEKIPDDITLNVIYANNNIFPSQEKQKELDKKLAAIKKNKNVKGKLNNFDVLQMVMV